MKDNIAIKHGGISLEAVLDKKEGKNAAIITHPHPLYGGNMDNQVVTTIAKVFFAKGFTTLRFNFRGTGSSSGTFGDGHGEQEDVLAAISFLKKAGYQKIVLAGYSFGSWVNALVVSKGCDIEDHIMVSPPVAFISFDDIKHLAKTGLVITGENDDIAPPNQLKSYLDRWQLLPEFKIIQSCDHFYSGCLNNLEMLLRKYL